MFDIYHKINHDYIIYQQKNLVLLNNKIYNVNIMKKITILIFDSGIGGLSIYNIVKKILPSSHYIYVFDNAAFPYGLKSEEFIINRVFNIIHAICKLHTLNLVIIACNTVSTIALSILQKYFSSFPIIGVKPEIEQATQLTKNGIIGLLATHATIRCFYTQNLIHYFSPHYKILTLGVTELANIAEDKLCGIITPVSKLQTYLHSWFKIKEFPDVIILGCTHFSFLKKELQYLFPKDTQFIDSQYTIIKHLTYFIEHNINIKNLSNEIKFNQIYYMCTTSKVIKFISILTQYGFKLYQKLSF